MSVAAQAVETTQTTFGSQIVVRAMSLDRNSLDEWIAAYFAKWPTLAYSTWSTGVSESPLGFCVTLHRFDSAD